MQPQQERALPVTSTAGPARRRAAAHARVAGQMIGSETVTGLTKSELTCHTDPSRAGADGARTFLVRCTK